MGLLDETVSAEMDGIHSVLRFKEEKEKEKRENLAKLFPITVELPFLMPLVKLLIKLPLTKLYSYIYRMWEGYCTHYRLFPRKMTSKAFIKNVYYHLHHDRG